MRNYKELVKSVFAVVSESLAAAGFEKRNAAVFTIPAAPGVAGWLELSAVRSDEGVEVRPVVGVRCHPLEALVAEWLERKPGDFMPATLTRPMGALTPENSPSSWLFKYDTDCEPLVAEMSAALAQFGRPFIGANSALPALYETLLNSKRGPAPDPLDYRAAAAAFLLGKRAEAETFVAGKLAEMTAREDAAAQTFRKFAAKLRAV